MFLLFIVCGVLKKSLASMYMAGKSQRPHQSRLSFITSPSRHQCLIIITTTTTTTTLYSTNHTLSHNTTYSRNLTPTKYIFCSHFNHNQNRPSSHFQPFHVSLRPSFHISTIHLQTNDFLLFFIHSLFSKP